jgi:AbiV family abortive infection protein
LEVATDKAKLHRSILACLKNGKGLLEDAEWSANRAAAGLALALLAQEECAKAFTLVLVRDDVLPRTDKIRRSLSLHECKGVLAMIMEWLASMNEFRAGEIFARAKRKERVQRLPAGVATAMNIYRHEMIERIGGRNPERYSGWRGAARNLAGGNRDRREQRALYVGIREDGDVGSQPLAAPEAFEEEFTRAKRLIDFAEDADRKCLLAFGEYELFAEVFRAIFKDLASNGDYGAQQEEVFPSGIPGVLFVKKTVIVVDATPEPGGRFHPRLDGPLPDGDEPRATEVLPHWIS